MRTMTIQDAINGIEGARYHHTDVSEHCKSDIYWVDYCGTRVGYRLNEAGEPILINREWCQITCMGDPAAGFEGVTFHGLLALLNDALAEDAREVPEEADISRWWDTYNAVLPELIGIYGTDDGDYLTNRSVGAAESAHGFIPENYRGPRPEKESKS